VTSGSDVMLLGGENVVFGDNVNIGRNYFIRAKGGLVVVNNVTMSRDIVIHTNSHAYNGRRLFFFENYNLRPVVIKNNFWIGINVTVALRAIIRVSAVTGISSRILGEITKGSIGGSGKMEVIRYRNNKHYEKLIDANNFGNSDVLKVIINGDVL
jgi:acetyltransferase-like isoleucine patch superfamily enzyme